MKTENKNNYFGLFQFFKQQYTILSRQKFEVDKEWFGKIHDKHYTADVQSKFDTDLFVDQGIGEDIFEFIAKPDNYYSHLQNELRILNDWVIDFLSTYQELKELLINEDILINENSRQYLQLELLKSRAQQFLDQIEQYKEILESKKLDKIDGLGQFDNVDLEVARAFNLDQIDECEPDDKFISRIPGENKEEKYPIEIVFRRLSEIVNQIRSVNALLNNIKIKVRFVHGNAGMGKSNLAAFLTTKLISEGLPVIFIKARSFSGDPDQFDKILLGQLEVPDNYRLSEVLDKLNNYGKENQKRITLIFDGLNETSYGNNGFSPIWRRSIDSFVEQLKSYPFLFLVSTLRTSYIERVWDNNEIPFKTKELLGFNNQGLLLDVVERYFNHYNIKFDSPDQADIFYFQTPLLLDLYCKMLNPDKIENFEPIFGLEGFVSVFDRYINGLSQKLQTDLGLVSVDVVNNGIERCSTEMLNEMGAFLPILSYYSNIEGGVVTKVDDTVAHSILEEYLIYLKESLNNVDVVVHTQQEVGGYLLAKALLKQYNNNINQLIDGDFFQNHIIGNIEEQHQLANDIIKFLIVLSGEYKLLIQNFGNVPSVKDYLWIKLQREESSQLNLELRTTLSAQLESKDDITKLLDSSKSRFFNPDSPLNFLFSKDEISKLKGFDIELTWTKFVYENAIIFSNFLKVDFHKLKGTDQLEIALEITIWLLESTSHNTRDEATKKLLEYGTTNPSFIFSKIEEYANKKRLYIYERLSGIAYGVCLRRQNDQEFVNKVLKGYAETVYNLQFSSDPVAPSYHYIVIDSFKHIIDLAIHLGVFELPEGESESFNQYKFLSTELWDEVTEDDMSKVKITWSSGPDPDPLSGDFVTYTIPRLLDGTHVGHLEAVAYIYKRLLRAGYESKTYGDLPNGIDKDFYFGSSKYGMEGKIDRLGKKYSWNAYFEYAGHLLNIGELPVFYKGDTSFTRFYARLSDVQIEVSNPLKKNQNIKLYSEKLLAEKSDSENWTSIEKFDSLKEVFKQQFDSKEFTLLYGYFVENEKSENSYNVRSFLLVEPCLVKKEDIEGKEVEILNRTMDWDHDLHLENSINNTYLGELYWADSIPDMKSNIGLIPSTETHKIDTTFKSSGLMLDRIFEKKLANKEKELVPIQVSLNITPAIVEYSWESDSEVYPSIRGNIPSPNIGKYLNLKADPTNFQIIDENGERAFVSVEYEEDEILKQESDYIRTDLLKKYLDDKGLVLMYQIKQHTFDRNAGDGSGDFRGMQFKIQEL